MIGAVQTRILSPEEWPKLAGTEAEELWPLLNPENARVIVVEEDGKIIATWTLMRVVHAECLWAAPEYRGSYGVTKRILKGMCDQATEWGATQVVTGSVSPHVTDLIMRFGGVPLPCQSFTLPVQDRSARRKTKKYDLELGRSFHEQLEKQITGDLHPDDDKHNQHVGRALRTAIEGNEPERAAEEYNAWAVTAGYEPIKYIGIVDGRMRADIKTAIVEVDSQYIVRVVELETGLCH